MSQNVAVVSAARSNGVRMSPYKLRLYADVIRGKSVEQALAWLKTVGCNRSVPLIKVIVSAYANAKHKGTIAEGASRSVFLHRICVNEDGFFRYVKPGARGRGCPQRKRSSRIEVILGTKDVLQGKTPAAQSVD
jgi:large subunit ribosomal protein L22